MKYYPLGSTGMNVSRLGLGTVKFGRNTRLKYAELFDLPDEQQVRTLLSVAREQGINLIDTAPAYGDSETKLGNILANERQNWLICTKAGEQYDTLSQRSSFDFSASSIRQSVQQSLRRLKTDYVDILLIHSNGDDKNIVESGEAIECANELKQSGLVRAFGVSTKSTEGSKLAIDRCDCVMLTFNTENQEQAEAIEYARQKGKGVLVKKPLASGRAASNIDGIAETAKLMHGHAGISSVIFSSINPQHLRETIDHFRHFESR